jgi:hypothetical protein
MEDDYILRNVVLFGEKEMIEALKIMRRQWWN